MVDIHSHVLHALDDGAPSFPESLAIAQLALRSGTSDLVATPHSNIVYPYQPQLVAQRIAALQLAIGPGLRIHQGCDFHLSLQNIQTALQHPRRFTINGLSYLLVEFPDVSMIEGAARIFLELQAAGMIPIVTHPERNPYLASDLPRLARWVEQGAYIQITAQSLLGAPFGPSIARWCVRAIEMGLVHFVASDAHDTLHRPPRLDLAAQFLTTEFGPRFAELVLESNPRAVIEGHRLDTGLLPHPRLSRKWYHFLAGGRRKPKPA